MFGQQSRGSQPITIITNQAFALTQILDYKEQTSMSDITVSSSQHQLTRRESR